MNQTIKKFFKEEDGLGTLEILLILAVLVAIAVAFRKWIVQFVNNIFTDVNENTDLNSDQDVDSGDAPGGGNG